MIQTITETMTVDKDIYICDHCKERITDKVYYCVMCEGHLHSDCIEIIEYKGGSDWEDNYCKKCWDIGIEYRKRIDDLKTQINKIEDQIEDVEREWLHTCKEEKDK